MVRTIPPVVLAAVLVVTWHRRIKPRPGVGRSRTDWHTRLVKTSDLRLAVVTLSAGGLGAGRPSGPMFLELCRMKSRITRERRAMELEWTLRL